MAWTEAKLIAEAILDGFDRHYRLFREITAGAKQRFEAADWPAVQAKAQERIGFYDRRVGETVAILRREFHLRDRNDFLWRRVKVEYLRLLPQHHQPELAETYYNSVFCRLFDRRYYNNDNIFVWPALSTEHLEAEVPTFRCYYPARDGFAAVICAILENLDFRVPYRDRRHDLRNILRAIRTRFPRGRSRDQNFQIAVLNATFYRNKGAYVIGKAINGADQIPFVIPVLNDTEGGLYCDTLLTGEDEIANVFSFSRAYFMVDTEAPAAVVDFLRPLMPRKGKAELYTAIGLQKFGKAEFYRDFLKHLRYSSDAFILAPGIPGHGDVRLHPAVLPLCLQGHQRPLRAAQGGHPRGGQGKVPVGQAPRPGGAHGRLLGVLPCRLPAGTLRPGPAGRAAARLRRDPGARRGRARSSSTSTSSGA